MGTLRKMEIDEMAIEETVSTFIRGERNCGAYSAEELSERSANYRQMLTEQMAELKAEVAEYGSQKAFIAKCLRNMVYDAIDTAEENWDFEEFARLSYVKNWLEQNDR